MEIAEDLAPTCCCRKKQTNKQKTDRQTDKEKFKGST